MRFFEDNIFAVQGFGWDPPRCITVALHKILMRA
jgi:hypothetical protein